MNYCTSANPAQVLANGNYNHMHMFRHFLTGQWGEEITTTSVGTLVAKQYVYTLPADINGVALEMGDLELMAYVAEGHQEIITGEEGPINFITPPGVSVADLEVSSNTTTPGWCDYNITPSIKVENVGTVAIDTFQVKYNLNGGADVVQNIYATLAVGASTTIDFTGITFAGGENVLYFNANVDSVYHLLEMTSGNNMATSDKVYTVDATPFGASIYETFESVALEATAPNHAFAINTSGAYNIVLDKSLVSGLPTELGAYGNSEKSFIYNFYNMASGISSSIVFGKMDFSTSSNYTLEFSHAYAQYQTENDGLKIGVSTDCGSTWTTVFNKAGVDLKTTEPVSSGNFFPAVDQWATTVVDLSAYDGQAGVLLKLEGVSDFGNNLFIDDIFVYSDATQGINDNKLNSVSIYPNPVKDVATIKFSNETEATYTVNVTNIFGQIVKSVNYGSIGTGTYTKSLDVSDLAAGIYMVEIKSGSKNMIQKIVVK